MDDLADAMRWISNNTNVLGLDELPEVYLMGHSSGAHVALLYLIRRAEDSATRGDAVDVTNTGDNPAALDSTGGDSGDNAAAPGSNTINSDRELEVEGFIGLSGVYDVHSHYLYESWR